MRLDVEFDASQFAELGDRLEKAAREVLAEMAQAQLVNIRLRVDAGKGLDDQQMPGYAKSTREDRQKRGRQVARRDLQDSGSMLNAMIVESIVATDTGLEATLGFATREDAAKAAYNQERAPWFGVSPDDEQLLMALADQRLKEKANDR